MILVFLQGNLGHRSQPGLPFHNTALNIKLMSKQQEGVVAGE